MTINFSQTAKTRSHLTEILSKAQENRLSPEQLFEQAGFDEFSVMEFYQEVEKSIQAQQIEEIRPDNTQVYLTLKKS